MSPHLNSGVVPNVSSRVYLKADDDMGPRTSRFPLALKSAPADLERALLYVKTSLIYLSNVLQIGVFKFDSACKSLPSNPVPAIPRITSKSLMLRPRFNNA